MAITGGSNIINNRKTNKEIYLDKDNVIDVTKNDLTELKSSLNIDQEDNFETKLNDINKSVEVAFQGRFSLDNGNNWYKEVTFTTPKGESLTGAPIDIIMSGTPEQINALGNYIIDQTGYEQALNEIKDEEIKEVLKNYEFEIYDLRDEINAGNITNRSDKDGNVFLNNPGEGTNEQNNEDTEYHMYEDYIDPYENWGTGYTISEDMDIANIYKDNKVRHYLEKIFDEEKDQKEIRKGTLKINLSVQDGLAGIIISLRKAIQYKDLEDENDPNYIYKEIYQGIDGLGIDEDGVISLGDNQNELKKELKELIDTGKINYNRKGGLDSEINKIAKILTSANRNDLDAFASLLQSKTDVAMATKEMYNAKELVKHNLINEENVLEFLCDFNSDGQISAEYNKKNNKKQKNQGDVGPLFGQQVYFTIDQAIGVQEVLYPGEGEQIVISNIIKNMEIADSRNLEHVHLNTMKNDPSKCTKENLALLINGDGYETIDGVYPMPEMKIFFLDAIKKINGGSKAITPDLYDNLVGKDSEIGMEFLSTEDKLKKQIEAELEITKNNNNEVKALIEQHGIVYVRQTLFTKIMTVIDNVEVTTNNGATTTLQAAGISKGWEVQEIKKEIIEKTIKQIVTTGLHYMKNKGFIIDLGKGQSGIIGKGEAKRAWSVGGGLEIGSAGVSIFLGTAGEFAVELNKKRVINADLSKVRDAHYLGIEAGVKAGINTKEFSGSAEATAGLFRHKDPIIGIEQINTQYEDLSKKIFTIEKTQLDNVLASPEGCKTYFEDRIEEYTSDPTYGEFVTTNEAHLKNNADFMVRYMAANTMFGPSSFLAKKTETEKINALNNLLKILQSGSIESRRHDVITGLHGKIDITKLSFGVTTSALTASFGRSNTEEPTASATSGETQEIGGLTGGGASNQGGLGTDKFGIAGFYVGLRISTWKNMYVPNTEQYLFTEYELRTGGSDLENITTTGENIDIYANYLEALYNDDRLTCEIIDGKIVMEFYDGDNEDLDIRTFLNIHTTDEAQGKFSIENNRLTIGNVGPIGAYTVTEAKGVRRVLCLGSKELTNKEKTIRRIPLNYTTTNEVEKIEAKHTGYENWTSDQINNDLIPSMTGEGTELDKAKETTAKFFDTEGKLIAPAGETVTFSPAEMEGEKVSVGTIVITKKIDGTYFVAVGTSPTDKLKIEYIDDQEYQKQLEEEIKKPESREAHSYTVENLFSFEGELLQVQSTLNTIANDIKDFEKSPYNTNKPEYLQFLSAASNIIDGNGFIDDTEINTAIKYLHQLLPNSSTNLTKLNGYLTSGNWYTKSFAVDRLKQIFAKDAWYSGKLLSHILARHSGWESVTGPSGTPLPKDLLQEFQTQRQERQNSPAQYNDSPKTNPNLLGYTAFYRYVGTQYKNVKFSMTSLGNTTSQVEPHIIKNDVLAQNRFLNNLEKNTYEVKQLAISLEQQFLKNGATVKLLDQDYTKTFENVKKLLDGDEIILDSGQKISIDINYVFYLLGECCNESVGIDIKKIHITTLKDNIVLPGKYTAERTPDEIYEYETQVFGESHSVSSRVIPKEYKAGRKHHQAIHIEPTAIATSGEDQEPGTINTGDDTGGETTETGDYAEGSGTGESE